MHPPDPLRWACGNVNLVLTAVVLDHPSTLSATVLASVPSSLERRLN